MRRCLYVGVTAGIAAGIFEVFFFDLLGFPKDILDSASSASVGVTLLAVLLIGPIEELTKYIVLRYNVYFSHDFNQVFDGVVYGITIALGFSCVENIGYFMDFYTTQTTSAFIILASIRGTVSTFAHVTFTGILGYFVGRAKFSDGHRVWIIVQGLLCASLLHSAFDAILSSPLPFALVWASILIVVSFTLFKRVWNRPDVRMVWQYIPPVPPTPR
jgi:RsiW-degrading membrane proteinase PrsW (M82 family)